ncbi:MAG TPA: hypothetical protein VF787_19820 [Thermoanaerobaculia bacterium]
MRRMQLLCTPPNMDDPNRKEASKLIDIHTHVPITVPFLDDGEVLRAYEQKYSAKHRALENDYASLCTPVERWQKSSGFPTKCANFCPVLEHCRSFSARHGEKHPLDAWIAKTPSRADSTSHGGLPTQFERNAAA